MNPKTRALLSAAAFLGLVLAPQALLGADAPPADPGPETLKVLEDHTLVLNTLWTLVAGFLVFWMNAGFALVETGFCRSKNATNILAKNFIVFAIATIAFWFSGFGMMFTEGSFVGTKGGFLFSGAQTGADGKDLFAGLSWAKVDIYTKFFFQLVFAGTAATIVSGAVAERIHFRAFLIFSFIIVGFFYPITGHWIWGAGWIAPTAEKAGMLDFAGSTVVHSVGGWAALAGILLLGPRIGKYGKDGKVTPIPGHSMALATLGALILWLGWFGFNPGSTLNANAEDIGRIALTTNLAAAAGMLSACVLSYLLFKKPDLGMLINGTLAGLVAITAPCAFVSNLSAIIIGLAAGILCVLGVLFFDKVRVDDPVGALSVHLVNGVFGTLAVGLFATPELVKRMTGYDSIGGGILISGSTTLLMKQLLGVVTVGGFTFFGSLIVWTIIKAAIGLRVSEEAETVGLDLSEMGMPAYHGEPLVASQALPGAESHIRQAVKEAASEFLRAAQPAPAPEAGKGS